jgi:Flp pilus assembly protein TadD
MFAQLTGWDCEESMKRVSLKKLLTLSVTIGVWITLTGCATTGGSGSEQSSESSSDTQESSLADLDQSIQDGSGSGAKEIALPEVKGPMVDTSEKSRVDSKYKPLSDAIRSGRVNTFLDEASKILAVNPNDQVALNALALYYLRVKKLGAAKIMIARALEKKPPTATLYNNLGVILLEEGEPGAALVNFKKALNLDDHHPETIANLGSLYVQSGDFVKALSLLEEAYGKNKSNFGLGNNYAIALRAAKKYDKSKEVYEELLKKNSRDVAVLLNYAILLIDYMNQPKDGLEYVNKVKFIEMDRKDVLTRANALEKKAKSGLN